MKPLKALITKNNLNKFHSDDSIYLIWYGDYKFETLFSSQIEHCIGGVLLDNTAFILIWASEFKDLKIPKDFRKNMIILKTPYTDILEAHDDILKIEMISNLIMNKNYEVIDN